MLLRMIACIFQNVMVNTLDLKQPGSRTLRPGFVPKIFITDISFEVVSATDVLTALRRAAPDLLGTAIDWETHRVEFESNWPEEVVLTWNRGHGKSVSWNTVVRMRRITVRVPFQLFAEVEAEAHARRQSLNQFCIDAFEAQLRTRSKRIELILLNHALRGPDDRGTPTTLGLLFNFATDELSDCSHRDLVEGVKRLHGRKYLQINKYDSHGGWDTYESNNTDDFFYRGEFKLKLTSEGHPYLEGLRAAFEPNKKEQAQEKK
jgi:hypothetical protein